MTNADAAVAAALSVVGQTEDPPGSNHCPLTRELDATFPRVPLASGGSSTRGGTSWCGSFTFWALWKSGYPIDTQRGCLVVNGVDIWDFYTPSDVNAWKRAGRWLDWRETPPVGALIYYDWAGTHGVGSLTDHVGIVSAVQANGQPCTVEGNTSPGGFVSNGGGVYQFGGGAPSPARPLSMIVGYGLPLYTPTPTTEDDMAVLIQDEFGNWFRAGDSVRNIGDEEIKALRVAGCPEATAKAVGWEGWNLRNSAGVEPNPAPAA